MDTGSPYAPAEAVGGGRTASTTTCSSEGGTAAASMEAPTQPGQAPGRSVFQQSVVLGEHKRAVSAVKFSRDGKLLASAAADTTVRLWDVEKRAPAANLMGHAQGVSDVAWTRDPRYLASASDDRTIRIWDVQTGQEVNKLLGHSSFVFCVTFNPQGSLIASGSCDEHVRIWDLRSGSCLRTLPAHAEAVTAVDFNRDGTCLVTASYDGLIRIWDTAMGQCLKTVFAEGNPPVSHARFSPNGKYLLASTLDSTLRLWSVSTPSRCVKTYRGHENEKFSMFTAFSLLGGGKHVVSGSEDSKIYVWDLQSRDVVQTLEGHRDVVVAVAAHPTQHLLASGGMSEDRTVRLWPGTEAAADLMDTSN